MRSSCLALLVLVSAAHAKAPARSLSSCVQTYGDVDMDCIGRGAGVTKLAEKGSGSKSVATYLDAMRSTLPGVRACHERSTLAKQPGLEAGIKVMMKVAADGHVMSIDHEGMNIDSDPALVDCILALFRPLRFAKPVDPSRAEVEYLVAFTTVIPARSIDDEAAAMCQVAEHMKNDPSWPRDSVLMETAVRFARLQLSAPMRHMLDGLATVPRDRVYAALHAGLVKLGVAKPDCAALQQLWTQ